MTTAPPSPPVAPEPAQENQAKRAEFEALAEKVGAPDVTVLASSGETAGDGVTIHWQPTREIGDALTMARSGLRAMRLEAPELVCDDVNKRVEAAFKLLLTECDEQYQERGREIRAANRRQEQAEREAQATAELLADVSELAARLANWTRKNYLLDKGLPEELHELEESLHGRSLGRQGDAYKSATLRRAERAEREAAAAESEREAAELEWQRLEAQACADRDAERAQKEALRVELEEARVSRQATLDILAEEFPRLGPQWRSCLAFVFGALGASDLFARLAQDHPQPAPAAPVAKEEATAEAWVPKVGDRVRHKRSGLYGSIARQDGVLWVVATEEAFRGASGCLADGIRGSTSDLEPAPQPPATTGEGRAVGPCSIEVDALRAEIVAALRRMPRLIAESPSMSGAAERATWLSVALADELERRKS